MLQNQRLKDGLQKYPKKDMKYTYGTAGFRMENSLLDPVMFKVGVIAALRSAQLNKPVGVMITASHNPYQDNGVKIVEPMGDMLVPEWETIATELCNSSDFVSDLAKVSASITGKGFVYIGRDTRPSGDRLLQALIDGINSVTSATYQDFGILTTPQLHYVVRCANDPAYGKLSEQGYYDKLAAAFNALTKDTKLKGTLVIDGANGVGSVKVKQLIPLLHNKDDYVVENDLIKEPVKLNKDCGSDFVKVGQQLPVYINKHTDLERCCSFDGDADRIVYYYQKDGQFSLLDGDYITALFANFVSGLLKQAGLEDVQVGAVQTAYANGASTEYFKSIGVPVKITCTGVKHLHHAAMEFGVGIYFESNGHGTMLFNPKTVERIEKLMEKEKIKPLQQLLNTYNLINQTVGDAMSDMLTIEAILAVKGWSLQNWKSLYTDLPSRQSKVKVANRYAFKATDADRTLVEPSAIQPMVDELVAKFKKGRSFVRPSGTEDIIRVYAEAETAEMADELAHQVCLVVYRHGGGVGPEPVKVT